MQSLFDEKVKGLVEELLHVDDSARFVVSLRHFVLIFIQQAKPYYGHALNHILWVLNARHCTVSYLFYRQDSCNNIS